ncbi:MAG: hypothetical protein LBU04_05085 [Christensenellaceae bacterium]|jgi:flagellar basal body-associated protein FliL|nr:hypothetical protein [Christensenellaceae bacterium]
MERSLKLTIKILLILFLVCLFFIAYPIFSTTISDANAISEQVSFAALLVGSPTHYDGNVYYSAYEFTLSGASSNQSYQYKLEISAEIIIDWSGLTTDSDSIYIDYTIKGGEISFRKVSSDNTPVRGSESRYEHKLYIDAAPTVLSFNEITNYTQTSYLASFNLSTSYAPYHVTITNPNGDLTIVPDGTNEFNVSMNGRYTLTISSDTGGIQQKFYDANRIDLEIPVFYVEALAGGNAGVWAGSATYYIIPLAIPKSSVRYWYSLDNGISKTYTDADPVKKAHIVNVTPDANGEIIFGSISGSAVSYQFIPSETDRQKFQTCVDKEIPTIQVSGAPKLPTNTEVILSITTSGNQSGTHVYYSIDGELPQKYNKATLNISKPGIYRFYAVSGAGLTSSEILVDITLLDVTPPNLKLVSEDKNYNASKNAYTGNVRIVASDYDKTKTQILLNGKALDQSFDDADVIEFTKRGNYTVEIFDDVGNKAYVTFEIAKPNVLLIVLLVTLTVLGVAGFSFLLYSNMKKAQSIRRLVESSTVTDEHNKFLMFKRIRKGGK